MLEETARVGYNYIQKLILSGDNNKGLFAARDALEKQFPKNATLWSPHDDAITCPKCGWDSHYTDGVKYCQYCGQRIVPLR